MQWHPFLIDPATDRRGESFEAYNNRRWGGAGWTHSMIASGRKDDPTVFRNWRWWPNSIKALALVQLSARQGRAGEAKERLLQLTYNEGANISDITVLLEVAAELGLGSPSVVRQALRNGGELESEVLECDQNAKKKLGIHGVPHFSINGVNLSGAQPSAELRGVLLRCLETKGV